MSAGDAGQLVEVEDGGLEEGDGLDEIFVFVGGIRGIISVFVGVSSLEGLEEAFFVEDREDPD